MAGIIDNLRYLLRGPTEQKQGMLPVPATHSGSLGLDWVYPDQPATDPRSLLRNGYETNSAVFACVQVLQRAFPEPELRWYTAADKEVARTHPLRKLWTRPNPLMGQDELLAFMIAYCALGGNLYAYKLRSSMNTVAELWPYHAAEAWPVSGPTAWIDHYAYLLTNGQTLRIEPGDIIHWKWAVNPRKPWIGMAPLVPVMREVLTDSELTRYLQSLLVNDAVPRGALRVPSGVSLSDKDLKRMKDDWILRHGGAQRGGVALLENGLEYQRIGLNMQELDLTGQRAVPERRIAGAWGIPVQVAGLGDDPTYSNYEQAELAFTRRVLVPLWKSLASELTADAQTEGYPDVYAAFHLREVAALQENTNDQHKRANQSFRGCLLTQNEARHEIGKDPVPGGDVFYYQLVPLGSAPPAADDPAAAQAAAEDAPPTVDEAGKARRGGVERKALAPRAAKVERQIQPKIERFLTGLYSDLADHVREK